jgi:hypothetical protein
MKTYNERLLQLLNRDHLPKFLNLNYPNEKMVEVGTYYGVFAEHVLSHWTGNLHCIDPWQDLPDAEYRDGCANGGQEGGRNLMEPIYQDALQRLSKFGSRVKVLRMRSNEALSLFDPGSLACVHVDGNHSYDTCLSDLNGWFSKIRIGGLIGTHDCYIRKDAVQNCGVWDAVWDFSHNIGQKSFLTNCSSAWWIKS